MFSSSMKLAYEGSVKSLFQDSADPNITYFAFTDDYSVFDWGKMPDQIAYKGKALSIFGGTLFNQLSQPDSWKPLVREDSIRIFNSDFLATLFGSETYCDLCENGLSHHFLGWVDSSGKDLSMSDFSYHSETPLMKVSSVKVNCPKRFTLDRQTLYNYESLNSPLVKSESPFLIPLEVVFRFGMPEGSSLEKRLEKDPNYAIELGLATSPVQNVWFERPIIELFTKLEPKDRFLSLQEAFTISALSEREFLTLYEKTLLLALWLYDYFSKRDIELWDGKFEFAWTSDGIILVDSIGPDELRLKHKGVHLSKEVIRQFYRDSKWEKAVRDAKNISLSIAGSDWKEICKNRLNQVPEPLSSYEKRLIDNLYGTLINHCLREPVISTSMTFEEVVSSLKQGHTVGVR